MLFRRFLACSIPIAVGARPQIGCRDLIRCFYCSACSISDIQTAVRGAPGFREHVYFVSKLVNIFYFDKLLLECIILSEYHKCMFLRYSSSKIRI
jgi:hypothetical protein